MTTRNRKLVPRIKRWTELNNRNNNNNNNFIAFCHRPFLPVTAPLEPTAIPTAQTSVSDCSAFRIICDVPSTAVFCSSESIECVPGMAFKIYFEPFVTIPVAPVITFIMIHFTFHILRISIHKLLYFSFFPVSFCTTFLSAGIATSISMRAFFVLFLLVISGPFAVTSLSVCTPLIP